MKKKTIDLDDLDGRVEYEILNCGIQELHGVNSCSVLELMALAHEHCEGGCYLFSGSTKKGRSTAKALAKLIYDESLGTITEAVGFVNPNSGNKINAYLWAWTKEEQARRATWVTDRVKFIYTPHPCFNGW